MNEKELYEDCFNPDESDLDYFLRRRKELGIPNPVASSGGLAFGGHDPSPDNKERWDFSPDELRTNS